MENWTERGKRQFMMIFSALSVVILIINAFGITRHIRNGAMGRAIYVILASLLLLGCLIFMIRRYMQCRGWKHKW